MFRTFQCTEADLVNLAELVRAGGVIVFPTDTVYGIGCDPYNDGAASRIFQLKHRDMSKGLPVLTNTLRSAESLVNLPPQALSLALRYWPGALTFIAPLKDMRISRFVTAGAMSLAVRVPANRCLLSLLNMTKFLVGTSANMSGQPPIMDSNKIDTIKVSGFDALLAGGPTERAAESTIIDFSDNIRPVVRREGAIPACEIMEHLRKMT